MNSDDRRAARAAYKERAQVAGVYAVRCAASGEVWVGPTPNLETVCNRLWFTLRAGRATRRAMQAAWTAHGAESFSFEALERLKKEEVEAAPYVQQKLLAERAALWRERLGAGPV